jgi:hypothetical protein
MYLNRAEDTFGRHPAWWGFRPRLLPSTVHKHLRLLLQLPLVESPALGLSGLLSMHGFHASSICRFYEPLMVLLKVRGLQADTPPLSAVSVR